MRKPSELGRIGGPISANPSIWKQIPGFPLPYSSRLPFPDHLFQAKGHGRYAAGSQPRISPENTLESIGTLHASDTQISVAVGPPKLGGNQ